MKGRHQSQRVNKKPEEPGASWLTSTPSLSNSPWMSRTLPTLRDLRCAENRLSCHEKATIGKLEVLNVQRDKWGPQGSVAPDISLLDQSVIDLRSALSSIFGVADLG